MSVNAKKTVLLIIGWSAVGLGALGAVLPLLPTTPFLLLAVWCFARSSYRMHRWLLYNRTFGPYLRDYKAGRGIPVRVKVWILTLLWGSLTYCAWVVTDNLWLRILFAAVAIGVTIHLLHLKNAPRRGHIRNILILSATDAELTSFENRYKYPCVTTGVGILETSMRLQKAVDQHHPDLIIQTGVAGVRRTSGIEIGDTFLISTESLPDLGAWRVGGFERFDTTPYVHPNLIGWQKRLPEMKWAESATVNACASECPSEAPLENMEGAVCFRFCIERNIDFLELRTVSNYIERDRSSWNIRLATRNLGIQLDALLEKINRS